MHTLRLNLTSAEMDAEGRLRCREDIIILQANKGNVTVVLDKDCYMSKLCDVLNAGPYRPLRRDSGVNSTDISAELLNEALFDAV